MERKILIGLSTGEYIRRADFFPSYVGLYRPQNSISSSVHGQSPASARNIIIQQAFDNDCTHIFFMDDDMIFPQDTLIKLEKHLDNSDIHIVSALYLSRAFPHRPVFFDKAYENGYCKYFGLTNQTGLVKGVNCGFGAVLISTKVFDKLEKPYVRLGEIEKDGWCDDIGFFNRCRENGFDVYCDLDIPIGHMSTMTIWPEIHDGKWMTNYKQSNGNVLMQQNVMTEEELIKEESQFVTK